MCSLGGTGTEGWSSRSVGVLGDMDRGMKCEPALPFLACTVVPQNYSVYPAFSASTQQLSRGARAYSLLPLLITIEP
jgi:hypothetical protein